jgi:type II secretory pathway pseudopilin PulG
MEQRLTTQQLDRIVGEVGRLANRRADELDRSQVQSILQELNLPPELLDEAMIQVQRKEALARERQRNIGIAIASVAALVIIGIGATIFSHNKAASIAKVTATQDRISLVQDGGENLKTVTRGSQLAYRVTLSDAPVGDKLNLTCNWVDPSGRVAHTNNFETKNITTSVWNTQCRYAMPVGAATGSWKVQILVGDKLLKQAPFDAN